MKFPYDKQNGNYQFCKPIPVVKCGRSIYCKLHLHSQLAMEIPKSISNLVPEKRFSNSHSVSHLVAMATEKHAKEKEINKPEK